MLNEGINTIGIWLGNGWYSQPKVNVGTPLIKMIIRLKLSNNTISYISTNSLWKQIQGPIRMNDIYIGEWYDTTYETQGWLNNYYNDSLWNNVQIINNVNTIGILKSSAIMPKAKKVESYTAKQITEPQENIYQPKNNHIIQYYA